MESYVYKKEVDWSLFHYGFAIPLDYQVVFTQTASRFLARGETKDILLHFNGKSYNAKLNNNNIDKKFNRVTDIVQVRYPESSDIAIALRKIFQTSYSYLQQEKLLQPKGSKKRITLPDEYKEYIAVYTTEYDDTYILEAITVTDLKDAENELKGKNELSIETDNNSDYSHHTGLLKIMKVNRLIGNNLKLLYGYRCQICGNIIGEEFGSPIAEAHHISYFVNSLNDDAGNQIVICPNHHRIIHCVDPIFDWNRHAFLYPNGIEQPLVLNFHLS